MFGRKMVLGIVLSGVLASGAAQADVTANIGFTSDYVFRGISQTDSSFAVQGGLGESETDSAEALLSLGADLDPDSRGVVAITFTEGNGHAGSGLSGLQPLDQLFLGELGQVHRTTLSAPRRGH